MPSYFDIAQFATRDIPVTVWGVVINVTENLMIDPKAAKAKRAEILGLIASFERDMTAAQQAVPPDATADTPATTEQQMLLMRAQVAGLRAQLPTDPRMVTCEAIAQRIRAWDLTDGTAKLPLDAQGLYDTDCPTELLEDLLTEVDKTPIIPEVKSSPSSAG